jgi:hypothetical protein
VDPGVLYVDTAVGSKELEPILRRRGVNCRLFPRLPADFALVGSGPKGAEWKIGVERKTLGDLGSSLLMNRLFGTQLPRMVEEYQRIWLVVEGIFRPGDDDAIEVWRPGRRGVAGSWSLARVPLTWSQLQGWLLSFDEATNGKGRRWKTSSETETALWLGALLRWWSKRYERHAGHVAIELNLPMPSRAHAMIRKPNKVQLAAFVCDRIGAKTALQVGRYFHRPLDLAQADRRKLRRAGLGEKDAETVWRWWRDSV